jgi:hypothetical protein
MPTKQCVKRLFKQITKERAEKIEYVWEVLGKHQEFRMSSLLLVINEALKWPRFKTDEKTTLDLEVWQREVVDLCESLANKLEGSRMDWFFVNRENELIDELLSARSELDSPQVELISKLAPELDPMVVSVAAETIRGGLFASDSLRTLAASKETDDLRYDSFLSPIHTMNKPKQNTAKQSHFAYKVSAFFMEELGDPQRECVAILIAAMFDCDPPTKRNIRRWARRDELL